MGGMVAASYQKSFEISKPLSFRYASGVKSPKTTEA
jgi:hypothetical protein